MNPLRSIDGYVVSAHQMLVEYFDQKPVDLARHCVTVFAVGTIFWVTFAFDPSRSSGLILLAGSGLSSIFLLYCSLSPMLFSMLGEMPVLRLIGFIVLAVKINGLSITPVNSAIDAVSALAMLSFLYFAACRPPRPKKRHEHENRLAQTGGA